MISCVGSIKAHQLRSLGLWVVLSREEKKGKIVFQTCMAHVACMAPLSVLFCFIDFVGLNDSSVYLE